MIQGGAVASTGLVRIGSITGVSELALNDTNGVNGFAGTLQLDSGIPTGQAAIIHGPFSGTIDLGNGDLTGSLSLLKGGNGTIQNVGVVGKFLTLTESSTLPFKGIATVASVSALGIIRTFSLGDMNGTITVNGNADGTISVSGDVNGDIVVGGDLGAKIDIGGSLDGDITVAGDAHFGVQIGESIKRNGRILIDGILSGDITIDEATVGGSLIRATDGLDGSTTVTVNNSRGDFNAGGSMYFGDAAPPSPVATTFDGNILIKDNPSGGFGKLQGAITVRGCHATTDDLDICICGTGSPRSPVILQSSCASLVTWSCVSGCP